MISENKYYCQVCNKSYKVRRSLWRHYRYECQKQPTFQCTLCEHKTKHKSSLIAHYGRVHKSVTLPTE